MAELTTTKMSSRGQVVIPEEVRKRLGLKCGGGEGHGDSQSDFAFVDARV